MLCLCEPQAKDVVGKLTKRIKQQMRSQRGKETKMRKTPGQTKEEWLRPQIADALQEGAKPLPFEPLGDYFGHTRISQA